jgi:hypothetical protein
MVESPAPYTLNHINSIFCHIFVDHLTSFDASNPPFLDGFRPHGAHPPFFHQPKNHIEKNVVIFYMSENIAITLALSHVPCEKKHMGVRVDPVGPTSSEAPGCGSLPSEPPHHRAGSGVKSRIPSYPTGKTPLEKR